MEYAVKPRVITRFAPAAVPVPKQRIPELDAIRGVAILLVLAMHYGCDEIGESAPLAARAVRFACSFGWTGVDLFFVLSGFLIGGILIENRGSPDYFQTFYIRRACRIFPLYYAWLAITGLLLVLSPAVLRPLLVDATPFWAYPFYVQNIMQAVHGGFGSSWLGVTWSLAVEEQFYLLFPLVVWLCPREKLPGLLVVGIASATFFRVALNIYYPHPPGFAGYVLLPCRWDDLLLGCLAAWSLRRPGAPAFIIRNEGNMVSLLVVLGAAFFLLHAAQGRTIFDLGTHLLGFSLMGTFYALLIIYVLVTSSPVVKTVFRWPWLRELGRISYGIYLLHRPVLGVFQALTGNSEMQIGSAFDAVISLAALVTTVLLAKLSWQFFESRFVRLGRQCTY